MKINIKRIITILEKLSMFLAEHIYSACLVFILLALIFGALLSYKYIILTQKVETEILETFQLKEETFQNVLKILENEKQKLKQTDSKEYFDLFDVVLVGGPAELTE